jgi:CubicO group peptidase (beta-lactamase class C family)
VLSHTGGLSYGWTNHPVDKTYRRLGVNRDRTTETLSTFVAKLGEAPLYYEPGERWMYSLSTDVCGYLVEAISGQRFDEYLRTNIFEPLGMVDTSFWVRPEKLDRFAANYQREPDKSLKLVDDPGASEYAKEPAFFSGGGGLTSTTADYLRFCEMLRRGGELDGARILGPRTIELMHMNHLTGGKDLTQMAIGTFSETAYEGVGFGLGFASTLGEVESGGLGVGDYYWGGAASTIFWVDPIEDLVVIFMTQLMPSATFNFRGQLKSIIYSAIVDD